MPILQRLNRLIETPTYRYVCYAFVLNYLIDDFSYTNAVTIRYFLERFNNMPEPYKLERAY